jgi:hypothetical protein
VAEQFLHGADVVAVFEQVSGKGMEEEAMRKQNRFPPGWNEARVHRVLAHYEGQSDTEAVADDEASSRSTTDGTRIITVPRNNPVNEYTMGGIVRDAWPHNRTVQELALIN